VCVAESRSPRARRVPTAAALVAAGLAVVLAVVLLILVVGTIVVRPKGRRRMRPDLSAAT